MNKADEYMYNDIMNIFKNGYKDVDPRPKYEDGTPAHTLSVNHVVRKYDLSKGEFPILTLRPIAWKTGIKELFAIYQNQSNKISEFERCGCNWWKPWSLEDGTIGKAYPYNLESHRPDEMKKTVKKIKCRYVANKYKEKKSVPVFEGYESIDGKIYLNRYKIIGINENLTDEKHIYYDIQFISNNYVTYMRKDSIGKSSGINPYDRTTYGVGYLDEYGDVKNFTEEEVSILKDKWENMFRRCYSEQYQNEHESYKGTFVHQDWHSFKNFLKDVKMLPQYFLAREEDFVGWDLDKDYYGSNAYSKDTCVFLKHSENTLYAKRNGCYKIKNEDTNEEFYEINTSEFASIIGENPSSANNGIRLRNKYKNYTFEFIPNNKEYVYRYELSRNQIVELVNDIKNNPYGRRHIMSFWHWANIDKKSLVECAYETIWNVRNNRLDNKEYLDMCLIQRSGDMLTASGAGCMNEVQYAALLMMIARHTGYEVGVFTHFIANEQIYDRHVGQAMELIDRYDNSVYKFIEEHIRSEMLENEVQRNNPRLVLNHDAKNFFEMTIDDFTLENYEPIKPQLKLELGI